MGKRGPSYVQGGGGGGGRRLSPPPPPPPPPLHLLPHLQPPLPLSAEAAQAPVASMPPPLLLPRRLLPPLLRRRLFRLPPPARLLSPPAEAAAQAADAVVVWRPKCARVQLGTISTRHDRRWWHLRFSTRCAGPLPRTAGQAFDACGTGKLVSQR